MSTIEKGISLNRAISIRRALHQIPEAGLGEFKTRDAILGYLENLGATLYKDIYQTSVIAHFNFKEGAPTIAFRADMDALSITEKNTHDFQSTHPGMMHACGHDGHMTMNVLLGEYLSKHPLQHYNVALIFQPAEEGPGGAEGIVQSGILKTLNVVEVYGTHVYPNLPIGVVGTKKGPLMAATSEMRVRFTGVSCHGAQPHAGRDSLVAGASFLLNAQTIVSRNTSPMASAVVTFGVMRGGERVNIIAPDVLLEGTMRSFDTDVHGAIQARLRALVAATAMAHDVQGEIEFSDMYPAVINDGDLAQMVLTEIEGAVEVEAEMLAEDFSYFCQAVPSLFLFLGIRSEDKGHHPLHSNQFDFDERALVSGVQCYIDILNLKEKAMA